MMEWEQREIGDDTIFEVKIDAVDAASMREAAAEIWRVFFAEVVPLHTDTPWDTIRIEFWPETGTAFLFPSRHGVEERIDLALVRARWEMLLKAWNAASGRRDFEKRVDGARKRVVRAFKSGYQVVDQPRPRVECFEYGEELIEEF